MVVVVVIVMVMEICYYLLSLDGFRFEKQMVVAQYYFLLYFDYYLLMTVEILMVDYCSVIGNSYT